MWNMSMLLLLILSFYGMQCKDDLSINVSDDNDVFDIFGWSRYDGKSFENISIGGVQYNIFDNYLFCWERCENNTNLSYPSSYDYPTIFFPVSKLDMKRFEPSNKEEQKKIIENAVNSISLEKNFVMDYGIGWADRTSTKVFSEIIVVWNKYYTYVIISVISKLQDKPFIKLGRGMNPYFVSKDFEKMKRVFYEISSKNIIRVGCINVIDQSTELVSFTITPNYLSNMGGEKIIIQGPCFQGIIQPTITIRNKKDFELFTTCSLNVLNISESTFYFIMPLMWHPGIYIFRFEYNNIKFETEAEIYSVMDSNKKYDISWKDSSQMNNPKFNLRNINLNIEKEFTSVELNLLNLANVEKSSFPEIKSYKMNYENHTSKSFILNLDKIDFDIAKHIGFFSINSTHNTRSWSKPFSLIWLRAYAANENKKYTFNEAECTKYHSIRNNPLTAYCPDFSKKAKFLLSKFQRLSFPVSFPMFDFNSQECYVDASVGIYNELVKSYGVTCCYNTNGSLIYGQDYYMRSDSIEPSYAWIYSPLIEPFKHFLYDRIPMMSCCLIITNNALCSKYWDSVNIISSDVDHDYAGNVFGDPHFIPFNGMFNYSFLSRGEYWLLKSLNDRFNLQGRFYSDNQSQSFLKGIAFIASSKKVMISTKRSSVIILDWMVFFQYNIITLPFSSNGINIWQSTDTRKLFIYVNVMEKYFVHMELTRFHHLVELNEYMNIKIYVSSNFQEIVQGGLLGKFSNETTYSGLYERSTNQIIQSSADDSDYFKFCKSWQLNVKSETLFEYVTVEEYNDLNSFESFIKIPISTNLKCENIRFCDIDFTFYGDSLLEITKYTYKERIAYIQDVKEAKYGKKLTCVHPPWSFTKLDSDSYGEGSVINIIGCMDPKMVLKNKIQKIECNSSLIWISTPNIDKEICIPVISPTFNGDVYTAIFIAVPLIILLLVVVIAVYILYFKKYKKNKPVKIKLEISTSQDPVVIGEVYDTWSPNLDEEDHYGVYSHIKKSPKTTEPTSNL